MTDKDGIPTIVTSDHEVLTVSVSDALNNSPQDANTDGVKKKKSFVQKFHLGDFCERATCHGLNDLYQATSWRSKALWGILLLLAYVAMTYQVHSEVTEYMKGPIITSINYEATDEIPFPDVYICPFHFIDWEYIMYCALENKTEVAQQLIEFMSTLSSNDTGSLLGNKFSRIEKLIVAQTFKSMVDLECPDVPQHETVKEFILRHSFLASAFIRDCAFEGKNINCDSITSRIIDKEYGVCYSVNVNRLKKQGQRMKQKTAGIGLSIVVDLQNQVLRSAGDDNVPIPLMDGALVRTESHIDPSSIGGHLLQPGTWTKIQLSAKEVHLVEFSNSITPQKCVLSQNSGNHVPFMAFSNNTPYSQQLCRFDCAVYWSYKSCNCVVPIDPIYMNSKFQTVLAQYAGDGERHSTFCNVSQFDTCVAGVFTPTNSERKNCSAKCLRPCDFVELDLTISQTSFPSKAKKWKHAVPVYPPTPDQDYWFGDYQEPTTIPDLNISDNATNLTEETIELITLVQMNASLRRVKRQAGPPYPYLPQYYGPTNVEYEFDRFEDNMIILDVAYHRMEVVKYYQNPSRTITSFLSNLGGQAGLWAGASVFTLLQLLAFCVHWSCDSGKRHGKTLFRRHR